VVRGDLDSAASNALAEPAVSTRSGLCLASSFNRGLDVNPPVGLATSETDRDEGKKRGGSGTDRLACLTMTEMHLRQSVKSPTPGNR